MKVTVTGEAPVVAVHTPGEPDVTLIVTGSPDVAEAVATYVLVITGTRGDVDVKPMLWVDAPPVLAPVTVNDRVTASAAK